MIGEIKSSPVFLVRGKNHKPEIYFLELKTIKINVKCSFIFNIKHIFTIIDDALNYCYRDFIQSRYCVSFAVKVQSSPTFNSAIEPTLKGDLESPLNKT
jgi:hypothetical protein